MNDFELTVPNLYSFIGGKGTRVLKMTEKKSQTNIYAFQYYAYRPQK